MTKSFDRKALNAFLRILNTSSQESVDALASHAILNFLSYRLPASASKDRLVGFREIKRVLMPGFSAPFPKRIKTAITFDSSSKSKELRLNYLENIGCTPSSFVARGELVGLIRHISLPVKVIALLYGIKWAIICTYRTNRSNYALLYRSLIEFIAFTKICSTHSDLEIFDFNQYEVDSNLFYLGLKRILGDGLMYYKFPSPGPLALHNSTLLTDVLCYNTPYHMDEIEHRKSTIRYKELRRVPMEQFFTYSEHYRGGDQNWANSKFDVAYYSHASWLRTKSGHADDGLGIGAYEHKLLASLSNCAHKSPGVKVIIYTHPRERKADIIEETKAHYKKYFSDQENVFLCENQAVSTKEFRQARVGVGVYSTILFERLACGCTTLIMSPTRSFPLGSSTLANITVDEHDFEPRLVEALGYRPEQYFEKFEIEDYIEPLIAKG